MKPVLLLILASALAAASPADFGKKEFDAALAARGLDPARFRLALEVGRGEPESYSIEPGRVIAGDQRGLMYGLLAAAEQIRLTGRLKPAKGEPETPMRGIRYFLHNEELERNWYYSREYWQSYFQMLARNRFNRFNLVFAHQTNYLAPPYPFWIAVDGFPEIRVPGLSDEQRKRNLEMLQYIAATATEYGIDFTLGVWEHNVQKNQKPTVEGITRENIGPYSYAALKKILELCPSIRSVQMRTNGESGIPNDQQVQFYRDYVYKAIHDAGHRVALDLRGWLMAPAMRDAAINAGVPLRLSSKYWAEDVGRPYQPAETFSNYSFLNFLEKPRPYDFYWELWGLGSHRLLLWGDPDFVKRAVPTFRLSGSIGFEIDPPLAQKGYGNRPGQWGVPGDHKWEFERYWLFYQLWGRLSYDTKTPESAWMEEMKQRYGDAAPDVMEAYRNSSRVINEIVAAHLADPNMYIWPEINPGGLIDGYIDVKPSDWRMIATIPEAVDNRIRGIASAKQTSVQTAEILNEAALKTEQALARIKRPVDPDFAVLALMARYHARKQMAAAHLQFFYRTGDETSLRAAQRELKGALAVWESVVKATTGVFSADMAFGPDDIGHWKDKLPYPQHDLKTLEERIRIYERFGKFDFGFDFGAPVPARRSNASYRSDWFVTANNVEPRFQPVDPKTRYTDAVGFGWLDEKPREAVPLALSPYAEVRATSNDPKHLPQNALFGDSIKGSGAQVFRVKTADGRYRVQTLQPDGTAPERTLTAQNGALDIAMPESDWNVAGLVITRLDAAPAPVRTDWPVRLPRPGIVHTAPKSVTAAKPLTLSIQITPSKNVTAVRLHYRALNQLTAFKTIEQPATQTTFTIPAADIDARWDLQYYFEVLNTAKSGWFQPDPAKATPYYVVTVGR